MGSYFPIPADFKFDDNELPIETSITLLNYPNNFQINKSNSIFSEKSVFFCIYYLKGIEWHKYEQIKCAHGESLEIKRKDINLPQETMIVVVPSENSNNPQKTPILPDPFSNRVDKSPVAERASYNFKVGESTTSYQGEYPDEMTKLRYGSFFSSDSLRLDKDEKTFCSLILINLLSEARLQQYNTINFFNKPLQKPLFTYKARSNKCNLIQLPKLTKSKNNSMLLTCSTSTFIPLFINVLKEKNNSYEISVEHTHPPSEMLWGIDKFKAINHIKKIWINK